MTVAHHDVNVTDLEAAKNPIRKAVSTTANAKQANRVYASTVIVIHRLVDVMPKPVHGFAREIVSDNADPLPSVHPMMPSVRGLVTESALISPTAAKSLSASVLDLSVRQMMLCA